MMKNENWKVDLGQIVSTPGVLHEVSRGDMGTALSRHVRGDWGDVCEDDKQANDNALRNGGRLLSSYLGSDGTKFWIITEADRSVTTLLLPSEY